MRYFRVTFLFPDLTQKTKYSAKFEVFYFYGAEITTGKGLFIALTKSRKLFK